MGARSLRDKKSLSLKNIITTSNLHKDLKPSLVYTKTVRIFLKALRLNNGK